MSERAARLSRYRAARERLLPRTSREAFQSLVSEALDELPAWVHDRLENVAVVIEEHSPPGQHLLGLYEGVNRLKRDGGYHLVVPDRITLYRHDILDEVGGADPEAIRREVRSTVIHEVAHHFGFEDPEIERLEREGGA